jgi:ABC-type branched-subunit amino acid transport system ATPase component/ABC-type branched-subunit amino acid transport system permease subunit
MRRHVTPERALVAVAAAALLLYPLISDSLYYQNMIILSLVFAIGAVGLNVISGYGGYISLGQGAFLGLGAYTLAILSTRVEGVSVWVWVPLAGVVAGLFAALLGVIALRTRGLSFVVITISFVFLLGLVATNWPSLTNGTAGITLPLPTWSLDYQNWPFYYSLAALLAMSLLLSRRIRRTKFGMGLVAMREDEDKAATVGVNTPVYKLLGFVASAVFVGMAGAIYGYYLSFVDPSGMFSILLSVQILLSMLLGGRGTLFGPVLGAFIIEPLNQFANNSLGGGNARLIVFGGVMAAVVLFLPRGIIPTLRDLLEARRTRGRAGLVGARLEQRERAAATERPPLSGRTLLEIKGLEKRFGGLRAVDGTSLQVQEGSITALIGPNGSGKTTVFNLVGGTMAADAGEVWFDGRRIDGRRPWERAHAGLGRTFQITRLFREMTVLENVVAPLRAFRWSQLNADGVSGAEAERAEELLEFVGMQRFRDQRAGALSYGQQKLVELAQVLMLDPRLILLDEPAGGINPTLIERMGEMIRELNAAGTTFLIVEHNMPFVLGLCDPVLVLARGKTIAAGHPDAIQRDPKVLDAYLGEDFALDEPLEARV